MIVCNKSEFKKIMEDRLNSWVIDNFNSISGEFIKLDISGMDWVKFVEEKANDVFKIKVTYLGSFQFFVP